MIKGYKASRLVKRGLCEGPAVANYGVFPTFEVAEKEVTKSGRLNLVPWVESDTEEGKCWYMPITDDRWTLGIHIHLVEVDEYYKSSWRKMSTFEYVEE